MDDGVKPPISAAAASTVSLTLLTLVTSQRSQVAWECSGAGVSWKVATTSAPEFRKTSTMAAPMPVAAPVTRTRLRAVTCAPVSGMSRSPFKFDVEGG